MLDFQLSTKDFNLISELVYNKCGINLQEGKKELVKSRLSKVLREKKIDTFHQYYKILVNDSSGDEIITMIDAISTNFTSFFREQKHFDFLNSNIFPRLKKNIYLKKNDSIRIWSAGCSSGEEVYTLLICFMEYFDQKSTDNFHIFATDISTKVLNKATRGVYHKDYCKNISLNLLRKYFQKGSGNSDGYYKVKEKYSKLIDFQRLNFMNPFNLANKFDIIFCRNVMIYFNKETQGVLVNKFWDSLKDGGCLFIGHSESLMNIQHKFKYIAPTIYQK